jgi:aminoglycoside 6'-N-acetyltransferase
MAGYSVRLRPAVPADIDLLRAWDTRPHVVAASGTDGPFEWDVELPRRPRWRELLVAEEDGRPVGFLQIIDPAAEETRYWGDVGPNLRAIDIWIGEEADLGRGLGTAMMGLALDRCFADGTVEAVLIDPLAENTRAHRFYERVGFASVGPRIFGDDHCLVFRLDRRVWQETRSTRSRRQSC